MWESESIKLDKMILSDAAKEFDDSSKIGFGIDGDEEVRDQDFEGGQGSTLMKTNLLSGSRRR